MALFESTISLPSPNSSHFIKLTDSNYLIWLHSATLLQRQLSYCSKLIPDALAYTFLPLLPLFLACAPAFKMAFKSPSFIPTALLNTHFPVPYSLLLIILNPFVFHRLLSILNGMTPRLKRSMHFSKIIHGLWFLPLLLRTWLGASVLRLKVTLTTPLNALKPV
ncbi:unnamed protein product [Prunus armeniaca]|uniref:Uncharacterized protein n=1 Tax=Prunus armeniaca TaxID=36596 RepID=A0A6J5XGM0_PRUAR|nr:unnamed protein product [Prunus armeniaca]